MPVAYNACLLPVIEQAGFLGYMAIFPWACKVVVHYGLPVCLSNEHVNRRQARTCASEKVDAFYTSSNPPTCLF